MSLAVVLASLALFVISFRLAGILPLALQAISRAHGAASVLVDSTKTDDEKERAARDTSIVLFGSFAMITALTVVALVPSIVWLALAVLAGLTNTAGLLSALLSWPAIVAALVFFAIDYLIRR